MNRRSLIGFGAALLAANLREAGAASRSQLAFETVPLWPEGVPGAGRVQLQSRVAGPVGDRIETGIARPSLAVLKPENPDGSALLIIPGGGYMQEMIDLEGSEIARRFADWRITSFVLRYRLPTEGWASGPLAPLQDAQRAMRMLRAKASLFGIDPERIGAMGFSAGGHLAANLSTKFAARLSAPRDETDRADARPSFCVLGYPVVSMRSGLAHEASREHLLGRNASKAARNAWSCERLVTADTPPCFLFAAADDPFVPVENSLTLFDALRAKKVPAEMHIFEQGGHSFGVRLPPLMPAAAWPEMFLRWGRARGYFRT